MAVAGAPYDELKTMLQSAVKSVQWTYILFWQLCPQQRVLVWGDGYYNGAIKTRKTVQPMEVSTEEAALTRSEQLRELYDSLAGGDHQVTDHHELPTVRRPSVALSPEDLTESEWFYLLCVSFSFPPGVGLVGEAYTKQEHLWLTGANEVDSTVFRRAILAKSAHIQTVVCIPLLNGVVELGTTEKVEEAIEFVQLVKSFFIVDNDNLILPPPKPALSAHSSNTAHSPSLIKPRDDTYCMDEEDLENNEHKEEEEDDNDEENGSDSDTDSVQETHQNKATMAAVEEANELLQLDISEDIRFGSATDGSNNLDSGFHFLAVSQADSCRTESATPRWSDNLELQNLLGFQSHPSGAPQLEESAQAQEVDTHYSHTVSTLLHNQLRRCSDSHPPSLYSTQSSFATWTRHPHRLPAGSSQSLLKYILFTVPFLHSNTNSLASSRLRKTTSHDELSANHVLAERRRREKLNERFIILRSLVPLVTKMDKASILGDTIEYLKQLRKKIQDLEARDRHDSLDGSNLPEKRKVRVMDAGIGARGKPARAVQVEVSIIESDALVELQCTHREGLLLDVMKKLREFGVEITTIQSCLNAETCTAEMRAKVKANGNNGKKISIMQVKRAINHIISPLY